jgi:hypothetical protein
VSQPRREIGGHGGERLADFPQPPLRHTTFRAYDAERGPDFSGMIPDRGGDAADPLDVFLVINGKAGHPDAGQFPAEDSGRSNGVGRQPGEDSAADDPGKLRIGEPGRESLAYGGTVDRSSGPDLLDDAYGAFGFALRYDHHHPIPEDRQAGAFARTVA